MHDPSLFHVYRYVLTIVAGTYVVAGTLSTLWRWQIAPGDTGRREALFRRYLVALLLRSRLRRFWLELVQIGVLTCILGYVIHLHR